MLFLTSMPSSPPSCGTMTVCWRSAYRIHTTSIRLAVIIFLLRDQLLPCTRHYHPTSLMGPGGPRASILAIHLKNPTADHNQPTTAHPKGHLSSSAKEHRSPTQDTLFQSNEMTLTTNTHLSSRPLSSCPNNHNGPQAGKPLTHQLLPLRTTLRLLFTQ